MSSCHVILIKTYAHFCSRRHHHPTATSVSATTAKTRRREHPKSQSAAPTAADQVRGAGDLRATASPSPRATTSRTASANAIDISETALNSMELQRYSALCLIQLMTSITSSPKRNSSMTSTDYTQSPHPPVRVLPTTVRSTLPAQITSKFRVSEYYLCVCLSQKSSRNFFCQSYQRECLMTSFKCYIPGFILVISE